MIGSDASLLWWTAGAHAVLALLCALALLVDLPPILGVHPALKPLKFAVSIALLLGTLACVVPAISIDERIRNLITWTLVITLVVEMVIIGTQAVRGTGSHFNTGTPLDALLWGTMGAAIGIMLLAMLVVAVLATVRPLEFAPIVAMAVRIGLWLVLLTAVSGFAMAGRAQHSVGGADGGIGLPITAWSREYGDLRVPHFFALHGLQALPVAALLLAFVPTSDRVRWIVFGVVAVIWTAIAVGTLIQALEGRPFSGVTSATAAWNRPDKCTSRLPRDDRPSAQARALLSGG